MSGRKHAEELGSLRPCDLDLGQARPSYGRAGGLRGGRALGRERDSACGNIFKVQTLVRVAQLKIGHFQKLVRPIGN